MWVLYAFLSAFFAGTTAILAKLGLKKTSSSLATALRTIVVLIFAWLIVVIQKNQGLLTMSTIPRRSLVFLILSGITTGASWLCYFKALQIGDLNKVVPIDKSSVLLTMALSFVFLGSLLLL